MTAPKSDAATIESRRDRLIELLAEGRSQAECSQILQLEGFPADRITLWRDIKSLQVRWQQANSEAWEKLRDEQMSVLRMMEESVLAGTMQPQEIDTWRKVRKDIADLAGLDAPSKSISATVSQDEPDWVVDFRKSAQGLTADDFPLIWNFMRSLPRKARVIDASCLPPKELSDGLA